MNTCRTCEESPVVLNVNWHGTVTKEDGADYETIDDFYLCEKCCDTESYNSAFFARLSKEQQEEHGDFTLDIVHGHNFPVRNTNA